jgi:acyl-homoserine lactone acylase PvdQ
MALVVLTVAACSGGADSSSTDTGTGPGGGNGDRDQALPNCRADAGGSNATDCATVAGTIVPPGTDYRHAHDEISMYDNLVQGYPELESAQLMETYFKDGLFHPEERWGIEREYSPKTGVTIKRDAKWGIPVIYGDTDNDAFFGAGYVTAEDRLTVMELLRALGRAEAFELLGTAAAWLADAEWVRMYPYTPAEYEAQIERAAIYGEDGEKTVEAVRHFVDGVNAYLTGIYSSELPLPSVLAELGVTPAPWTMGDVVAAATVVRAMFGADGGAELGNAAKMMQLRAQFGDDARRIYDDFRNRNNHDAPVHTTDERFEYNQRDEAAIEAAANAMNVDTGDLGLQVFLTSLFGKPQSLSQYASMSAQFSELNAASQINWDLLRLDTQLGVLDLSRSGSMSNAMVIDGSLSDTGRPIQLGGPQTGYFSPQILFEFEAHGETVHTRGAGFPGLSFAPVIGRASNYAWTATAGGSDMVDTFVEVLCEPNGGSPTEHSRHYLHNGECKPMSWFAKRLVSEIQQGTIVPELAPVLTQLPLSEIPLDQIPLEALAELGITDIIAERTVHGPVVARSVLTDGDGNQVPVAVVRARTTLFKEADGAVTMYRWVTGKSDTAEKYLANMHPMNLSTNWMWNSGDEIAYYHGGLFPVRNNAVDPDFPVLGTGEWDWQGLMPPTEHPQEANPERGFIVSWNNKHSPNWGASDTKWNYSALYRADMLEDKIVEEVEAGNKISAVRFTQLMEEAGLTDFRGSHVLPLALRLAKRFPELSPGGLIEQWLPVLDDWVAHESLRRDGDNDGNYDRGAAVTFMDNLWNPLIDQTFTFAPIDALVGGRDNAPGLAGSAYQGGHYGHMWTELSMALGDPVNTPTSQRHCGADALGDEPTAQQCAERIWAALDAAAQASGQPGSITMAREEILFIPVPDATADLTPMHWVNRPTYQQLMSFE